MHWIPAGIAPIPTITLSIGSPVSGYRLPSLVGRTQGYSPPPRIYVSEPSANSIGNYLAKGNEKYIDENHSPTIVCLVD